jgi:hypothetical protein
LTGKKKQRKEIKAIYTVKVLTKYWNYPLLPPIAIFCLFFDTPMLRVPEDIVYMQIQRRHCDLAALHALVGFNAMQSTEGGEEAP